MKNTIGKVTIPVEEYNNLRDFRETILKDGAVITTSDWQANAILKQSVYTKEESVAKLVREKAQLRSSLAKAAFAESEIRKMNVWQFMKWRRTKKN